MNMNPREFVRLALEIAWRRRMHLILPVLLMIPLALAFYKLAPRTYVAKSLMLFVETNPNPLAKDSGSNISFALWTRVDGLRALLLSDRVLDYSMRDILGPDLPKDERSKDLWKAKLAERLSLDPMGADFLEIKLKSTDPKGMGRQLEIIVSRFLDALLPGGTSLSATDLLTTKRKEELDAAIKAYNEFKARVNPLSGGNRLQLIKDAMARYEAQKRELEDARGKIQKYLKALGSEEPNLVTLNAEISRFRDSLASEKTADADKAALAPKLELLVSLQTELGVQNRLQRDMATLAKSIENLQRADRSEIDNAGRLHALAKAVDDAKALYDSYVSRYGGQLSSKSNSLAFAAPERIKLVDLPEDPTVPEGSLRKYLLIGLLSSIFIGALAAALAELLDPRIYKPQQVVGQTGLPVLARLP